MTHRELIEELADSANITKRQAEKLLGKLSMIVMSEVKHGQKVNITGFGTFYLQESCEERYQSNDWRKNRYSKNNATQVSSGL